MKSLFILLLVLSLNSFSQQIPDFELPIYFEDAVGNRDTIY